MQQIHNNNNSEKPQIKSEMKTKPSSVSSLPVLHKYNTASCSNPDISASWSKFEMKSSGSSQFFQDPTRKVVLLVSYRLPIVLNKTENGFEADWDYETPYVSTENSLSATHDVWWFGAVSYLRTTNVSKLPKQFSIEEQQQIRTMLRKMKCIPIFLDPELNDEYYHGYCKRILDPVLHMATLVYDPVEGDFSLQKDIEDIDKSSNSYRKVNALFAKEILNACKSLGCWSHNNKPTIWINGYQLFLLPRDLRILARSYNLNRSRTPNMSPNPLSSSTPTKKTHKSPISPDISINDLISSPPPFFTEYIYDDIEDEKMMSIYQEMTPRWDQETVPRLNLSTYPESSATPVLNMSATSTPQNPESFLPASFSPMSPLSLPVSTYSEEPKSVSLNTLEDPSESSYADISTSTTPESSQHAPTLLSNTTNTCNNNTCNNNNSNNNTCNNNNNNNNTLIHNPMEKKKEDEEDDDEISLTIIFFLHLPFPTFEIFRHLPLRTSILRSMLSSDLVGFHTYSNARHFVSSVKRHLGVYSSLLQNGNIVLHCGSYRVTIEVSHIGLDVNSILNTINQQSVLEYQHKWEEKYKNMKIIAGVDELTRTSGIIQKMKGFEHFLQSYPMYIGHVVLVQICYRVRSSLSRPTEQIRCEKEVTELCNSINEQYGPCIDLQILPGSLYPAEQRMALWQVSDVYFNASLSEGLNLHPQEFICFKKVPGVVILSEFSNASEFLNGAILINPWNTDSMAHILERALEMSPNDRLNRRNRDEKSILERKPSQWTRQIMEDMYSGLNGEDISDSRAIVDAESSSFSNLHQPNLLDTESILKSYKNSKYRVILLDYGGTLVEKEGFERDLKDDFLGVLRRKPHANMLNVLNKLSEDPKNHIWIISSSEQRIMIQSLEGINNVGMISNSGMYYKHPHSKTWKILDAFINKSLPLKNEIESLCNAFLFDTNGVTMSVKDSIIRWDYQYADPDWGKAQAERLVKELHGLLDGLCVDIFHDLGVIEIRPMSTNRGIVIKSVLEDFRKQRKNNSTNADFVLCIGDSDVDENTYDVVPTIFTDIKNPDTSIVTITTGCKASKAKYYTHTVYDNFQLFNRLTSE